MHVSVDMVSGGFCIRCMPGGEKEADVMLLIAIVDDDPKDAEALQSQVGHFFKETGESYILQTYSDGVELIRSREEYDIVFLDIRMEKLDGIEAARFMRKISKDTVLIFVTYMAQFAIRGYEVDAMDFIIKPTDQFSIDHVLTKAMRRIQSRSGVSLMLRTPKGILSLSSNSICFVEVYNHDLIYHTEQGEYKVRGQLSEVRKKLDEQHFILCNRSYLVNLRHISSVHDDYLVVHGEKVQISKSHRKEIEQRFINYLGESI